MQTVKLEPQYDQPICTPVEKNSGEKFYTKAKGWVKKSDFLEYLRTPRNHREVHSDGFLALHRMAVECECGGCCTYQDMYICPRCGKQNVE